jgi:Ca2+-transporting ATPase
MRRIVPYSRLCGLARPDAGLTQAQAAERLRHYGANAILETGETGWSAVLKDTFRDPMIWFLVGTALLFLAIGEYPDAAVLAAALLPIAGMDAWLHRRTRASAASLSVRLATTAVVERDGAPVELPAADLVPGDLAIVAEGRYFPADGVVLSGEALQADESSLTGESMPVRKRPGAAPAGKSDIAVDSESWAAAGTRLLTGTARVRIVYTGAETLYGQIVRLARASRLERTPLQVAIGSLVGVLVVVAVALCLTLAGVRYLQGFGALDATLSAVTLAVAAIPEEFPVVFAFFLGVGVYRLARRQALVRRAVVVENIGRITCICTDKTGTLTEGELRLAHLQPGTDVPDNALLRVAATAARRESGDPLDLILLAKGMPVDADRLATFPFTEDRRREVALLREPSGTVLAAAKGAPETILAMCRLTEAERAAWMGRTREWARTGHKVIACASRRLADWPGGEPDRGYDFLGLLAFEDPVREGVAESVAEARAAGIRVVMVTGDHPLTAAAIARDVGIGGAEPQVIEGRDLESGRAAGAAGFDVVARAVPAQKLQLVRALRAAGEIVAVTGDGVNDVPALQGADVGIAMGERGTRSAREAAAIVLLDDNFRTIVRAVAEGRQLFLNLKLSFAYLLMIHAPLVLTAAIVPLLGYPLLYLPVHIAWLELIIHPTALLVFQRLPPTHRLGPLRRRARTRFFGAAEWLLIGFVGLVITAVVLIGYHIALGPGHDVLHARAMSIVALVVASATVTAGLAGLGSRAAVLAIVLTLLSGIILVQVAPLAALLRLSPLHPLDWLSAAAGGLLAGLGAAAMPRRQRPVTPPADAAATARSRAGS